MRRTLTSVLALLVGLAASGSAAAQDPGSAYCEPTATAFDPADVPAGGSAPVTAPRIHGSRLSVGGQSTRVLESGRRNARTAIVFVHGIPGSAADWVELLPRVAGKRRRAVAFDLPGFGHAAPAWGLPRTLDPAAEAFDDALAALGIRRAHLVLHDIGGPIGLEWGARHPRRLRSVTLIDTGMLFGYRHHYLAQILRTPGLGESFQLGLNRELFASGIQSGQTTPLPDEFVHRMYDDYDRETRCAVMEIYRGTDEPEIDAIARRQAEALRRREDRPALVIWGADDPYLPAGFAEQQRQGLPSARIEIYEDSGHWPFVDDPGRTGRLIARLVRKAIAADG